MPHPTTAGQICFRRAQKTLLKTACTLDHKTNLDKFQRIEIMLNMFYNHSRLELEINNKKMRFLPKYLEIKQ